MDCIAHRGFAGTEPENTLAAVRAAGPRADLVEVDVRRCGSGDLVVIHDERVDRTTDGAGRVADHSLASLRALDVLGTGRGVPTLAEVVGAAGPRPNVELKEPGLTADALAVAEARGRRPLVSSFLPEVVRSAADRGADAALLVADRDSAVERAGELGCVAVHPHHDLCDPAFVERAHGAGLAVNAWTVRSAGTAERLSAAGVDGLIADAPGYCDP